MPDISLSGSKLTLKPASLARFSIEAVMSFRSLQGQYLLSTGSASNSQLEEAQSIAARFRRLLNAGRRGGAHRVRHIDVRTGFGHADLFVFVEDLEHLRVRTSHAFTHPNRRDDQRVRQLTSAHGCRQVYPLKI